MTPDRMRLDSWKEIAQYLGRDVRTVIRWERDRGLPVSRVPGGRRSRVFAYQDELDQWLSRSPDASEASVLPHPPDAGPRWPTPLLVVGLLAAVVTLASLPDPAAGAAPVRLGLTDSDLQAFDRRDQLMWSRRVTTTRIMASATRWSFVGHLDGDRTTDLLAAVGATPPPVEPPGGESLRLAGDATLWRYTAGGDVLWSTTVADQIRFRDDAYGPPWALADLTVHRVGGRRRIAWAVHHFTWWPSLLISLDEAGRRLGTFVNAGWIRGVEATPDGRHLLVTGVSNAQRSYFLAVLDASHPVGHSPEPPGSATECVSCDAGDPVKYFVWPRTDVSTASPFPADGPSVSTFASGAVHISVHESAGPTIATTIYELSADLNLQTARFSDAFWGRHEELHRSGSLSHGKDECPERKGRQVSVWTPASGWQAMTVAVR